MSKSLQFQFPGASKPARQIIGAHACEVCGTRAHHGYGASYLRNTPGRWRCGSHRLENEARGEAA
jgi:hypothetical protein